MRFTFRSAVCYPGKIKPEGMQEVQWMWYVKVAGFDLGSVSYGGACRSGSDESNIPMIVMNVL